MTTFGSTSETSVEMRMYTRDLYGRLEAETGLSTGFELSFRSWLAHRDAGNALAAAKGGRRERTGWPAVNRSWGRGAGADSPRSPERPRVFAAQKRRGRWSAAGRCAGESLHKLETFLRSEKRDSQSDVGEGKEEQAEK